MKARHLIFVLLLCSSAWIGATPQGKVQRVVAVGDIHGDLDAFVGILQRAHLIDPTKRWSGGPAILVQTGDFLDRGPKARGVMDLLISLQKDAPRQGGRVLVLMGNHEAMNIFGDRRYVTNNDYAAFADDRTDKRKPKTDSAQPAGFVERCEALSANGKYGKWLRSLPAIARVQDSIFLHGGISPDLASYTIEQLNEAIAGEIRTFDAHRDFLVDKKLAQPCDTLEELTEAARTALEKAKGKDAETLKAFLAYGSWLSINEKGPLWFRGYAQWADDEGSAQIRQLTTALGVTRFVVGHTPQAGGQINSRFDGKVYLIDTGMLSSYYPGGRASALNIQDGKVSTIY
jgi:Calcineurin-like phosphoesterase